MYLNSQVTYYCQSVYTCWDLKGLLTDINCIVTSHLVFSAFCLFVLFIYLNCTAVHLQRFTRRFIVRLSSIPSLARFLCHLVLTVILLHFLLVFICLCFLLHLFTDFLSLFLLSNSIHERCTLHHSVSLYLCLPFIFSTPLYARVRWREGGRERERIRGREGKRWTD